LGSSVASPVYSGVDVDEYYVFVIEKGPKRIGAGRYLGLLNKKKLEK